MAFSVKHGQAFRTTLLVLARKQLSRALKELDSHLPEVERTLVHDIRRSIKRVRALIRWARPSLPGRDLRKQEARLRDIANRLSLIRDAEARLEAFQSLFPADRESQILARLQEEQAALTTMFTRDPAARAEVARGLRKVRRALKRWRRDHDETELMPKRLVSSYRRARSAFRRQILEDSEERRHDVRKRVKELEYAFELILPLGQSWICQEHQAAARIAQILGNERDLALLQVWLTVIQPDSGMSTVLATVVMERIRLQRKAYRLLERLILARPRGFADHLQKAWDHWRGEG